MNRILICDTETTGLSTDINRLCSIASCEIIDDEVTGNYKYQLFNPIKRITDGAYQCHGFTNEALAKEPLFKNVAQNIIDYFGDATLVFHNAPFDMATINNELKRNYFPQLRNKVIDTCQLARDIFSCQGVDLSNRSHPMSLDGLTNYFNLPNLREKCNGVHGALIDVRMLTPVYFNLIGIKEYLCKENIWWTRKNIVDALSQGVVHIEHFCKNGARCKADMTLQTKYTSKSLNGQPDLNHNPLMLNYFDVNKMEWRTCYLTRLAYIDWPKKIMEDIKKEREETLANA